MGGRKVAPQPGNLGEIGGQGFRLRDLTRLSSFGAQNEDGSLPRCSLWIYVAIPEENAPGFRNRIAAGEGKWSQLVAQPVDSATNEPVYIFCRFGS
jgi:hypothetical protein